MQPNNNFRTLRIIFGLLGISLLSFHFYYYCYAAFTEWRLTGTFADRFAQNLHGAGLFNHRATSKLIAYFFLALTLIGVPAGTDNQPRQKTIRRSVTGLLLYLCSDIILLLTADPGVIALLYILATLAGLALLYAPTRIIFSRFLPSPIDDVFNRRNESFPQEERLIANDYSLHFKARYTFRNQTRKNIINLLEIHRGTLVMGKAGSGKTRYFFRPMIRQSLVKNMVLFVFDLKYDDLTRLTYNLLQQEKDHFPVTPAFYSVNFDDLSRSHRCNPLDPASLDDIADAAEIARTMLLALNKRFIHLQGDFWVESAIRFFTASIWFLRRYENGRYCTLAHLIELIQADFTDLFSILRSYPDIETIINPFVSALTNNSHEQLQGQVDSARIALSTLASPNLYYLLSANEFTLDLNNPKAPKIICIASNPQKQNIYGAVISLYVTRMLKLVNKKGGIPCHLFFDEFTSFYCPGMDTTLATARSNKVAITLGIQTVEQLRALYGRDQADVLFNLPANLLCSQVSGDSARLVSEQIGRILQPKSTVSTNSKDTSTSESHHLDLAIPPSRIATLSSGEFVGITADSPSQPLPLKAFHAHIIIDNMAPEHNETTWGPIPEIHTVTTEAVELNFIQIKSEVREIIQTRLQYMQSSPTLRALIIPRKKKSKK